MSASPPKPWWVWKAPKCAEISHFDVAFAVKEYISNQVGQIQKEKRTREWSDWCIDDLQLRPANIREECKARLIRTYPGLLTGPHGASLRQDPCWQPVYVVSGIVLRDELKTPYDTDLVICTVLWHYYHPTSGHPISSALTFFNNHLDEDASFSTFVIDGATTSRSNPDVVGEMGKGFILATQYLHELVEEQDAYDVIKLSGRKWKSGVSFRVGHQIGELNWRHTRNASTSGEKQLQVVLDGLYPWTMDEFLTKLGLIDEDNAADTLSAKKQETATKLSEVKRQAATKVLNGIYRRRFAQRLAERVRSLAPADACDPSHEICRVQPDEVAITVVGLPGNLSPTEVFSGTYGIIQPEHVWRVLPQADTPIYFFKSDGPPLFYHRDQIMRSAPSLNRLSINYRGNLDISADRTAVTKSTKLYFAYRDKLSRAAHLAFEFLPDLAKEIALDVLTDPGVSGSTLSHVLHPLDTRSREGYRKAFNSAWRTLDPTLPVEKSLYPYPVSAPRDLMLIEELGMIGRPVHEHVMQRILHASGAFNRIHHHAERVLLRSPPHQKPITGFKRLRRAISSIFPSVGVDDIIVVDYTHSRPKIVWNVKRKKFVMGLPEKCSEHTAGGCLCWVGPQLFLAIDTWRDKHGSKETPSRIVTCREFVRCMEGVVDMMERDKEVADDVPPTVRIYPADEGEEDTVDTTGDDTPRNRRLSNASEATVTLHHTHGSDASSTIVSSSHDTPPRSPLSGIFNGVIDLCQRGLQEATGIEAERAALKSEAVLSDTTIQALHEQANKRQDDVRRLRDQLELKEAELDYTRGLLTAKWASSKRAREVV